MDKVTMKAKILAELQSGRRISFAQLVQRIPSFEGDKALGLAPNVLLWTNVAKPAADALIELMNAGQVKLGPASKLDYLIDGIALRLPIADGPGPYKQPHWLPAVLDLSTN